jgi:hypothetical protein
VTAGDSNGEHGASGETAADDLPRAYASVRSTDTGAVALVAAGGSRLALASVSGVISVLAPDAEGDAQFDLEGRPQGLAVGSLVYAAVDDTVYGYSFDGTRRWETSLDGVTALCWVPGPSRVIAATNTGAFVFLDADEGTERGRIDRIHEDVSEEVLLAGRNDEFLAGESWYLTGFGPEGDRRGEAMLDGTITGVGLLDGIAVVSLHGGKIVGVDADDGRTRWTQDVDVGWLAPRGEAGLYAAADRGLVRITADGSVTDVGVDASGSAQVAITTDGGVACRIDGRTAEVLRPRASLSGVDMRLSPMSLRAGEELTVTVETRGGPTTGAVRVSGDNASFQPESQQVSLDAGGRAEARFTLAEASDTRVTASAVFDPDDADTDTTEAQATLQLPASASTPVVDASIVGIDDGAATVDATVRMAGGSDLPAMSLSPGDVDIVPGPGQSSASRTLSLPLGADAVTATTADGESIEAAVSVPVTPLSVSVDGRDDGFVDVTLENDAEVPVDDTVRVTGDPLSAPVERPVSLDPGARLTLVLPASDAGAGEIHVDAAAVETTAAVSLDRAAFPSAGESADRPAGGGDRPRGDRSTERNAGADASAHAPGDAPAAAPPNRGTATPDPDRDSAGVSAASRTEKRRPADTPAASDAPGADSSGSDDSRRDSPGSEPGDKSQPPTGSGAEGASAAPSDPTAPPAGSETGVASPDPIDLTRHIEPDAVQEGYAIEETLTIENRSSDARSVTVRSDGEESTVELPPETEATASRYHAGWDAASIPVPAVTARTGESEATVPSASITVEPAPVVVRPTLSVQSDTTDVRLDVTNTLETPCSVLEIGSKGFSSAAGFEDFEVAPGGEGSRETTYQGTPTERPALTFVRTDTGERPLQTLAAVHEPTTPPVSVTVDSVDVLGDRDTNIVLRVRNEGAAPLDVRVEATGAAPDEYLYAAGVVAGLDPGEAATHRVECTVDDDHIELPVELETTPADGRGDARSTTVTVSGDRTGDAGRWQVDDGDDDDDASAAPATLSTPLDVRSVE